MGFTQDFLTSRRNIDDGSTRIGEHDRLWYSSIDNTIRIGDNVTPGGIIVSGGGGGSSYVLPTATDTVLGGIKIGGNLTINNGVVTAVNQLGNLSVGGSQLQSILGSVNNADIEFTPSGSGSISVPSLKIPTGSIITGDSSIVANIANIYLAAILDHGDDAGLVPPIYGLTNGITGGPYTVYELVSTPIIPLQIGDIIAGAGIPIGSTIIYVGSGSNDKIVITDHNFINGAVLPYTNPVNSTIPTTVARATVNAGLSINTQTNTNITLNTGPGGYIVPHSDIIPYTTNTWSLGSPARRFKEIWLGSGTIYVQDETLGNDQAIGARDGNLYIAGGAGLEVGQFTLRDNMIKISDPTIDILIGSTVATGNVIFNRPIRVNTPAGGNSFSVSRYGLTTIQPPVTIGASESALNITLNNYTQPRNFTNTLLQMTGKDGEPSRVSLDSFGTGSYPVIAGRQAGGTAQNPTATMSNDTLLRFSAQGWGTTNYVSTIGRINIQATQNFTDTTAGTRIRFQTTPTDSLTIQTVSADIDYTGLSLFGNSYLDAGITFKDGTRQTTAATILPNQTTHNGQYLKTDGTSLSWATIPVATVYRGVWDAATNTPHLQDGVGEPGDQYVVSIAGTQNLGSGNQTFVQSDFVYYNGTIWERVPTATVGVNSIQFGSGIIKTGAVQVSSSDIVNTIANGSIVTAKLATDYINFSAGTGISVTSQGHLGGNAVTITNTGITNITAGTGISVSGTNSITLTNTGVTSLSGTNHISVNSSTGGVTVTSDANALSVANTIALRNGAGGIDAIDFTATGNSNTLTDHGLFNYGTLSYSDTGIMADFSSAVNSYNQVIIQNTSSGDSASANYIVSNNLGSNSAYYGEFGMNSSGFTGAGSMDIPSAVYLSSASSDLVIATIGNKTLHFVTNGDVSSGDAMYITGNGIVHATSTIQGTISSLSNHSTTDLTEGTNLYFTNTRARQALSLSSNTPSGTTSTLTYDNISGAFVFTSAAPLVSGSTIKTVNGNSLLGSGNVSVGTVTSVNGTGTVSGLTLSGTVTTTGNLTLGGTIDKTSASVFGIAKVDGTSIISTNGVISATVTQGITSILPATLDSTHHIASTTVGTTSTLITDATTSNVANTIVLRDSNGNINVSGWVVGTHITGVNYTATVHDFWIGLTSKHITVTLPNAANGAVNGRQYQICDLVYSGNPGQSIVAQSPATVVGHISTSQQSDRVIATYVDGVWYCN